MRSSRRAKFSTAWQAPIEPAPSPRRAVTVVNSQSPALLAPHFHDGFHLRMLTAVSGTVELHGSSVDPRQLAFRSSILARTTSHARRWRAPPGTSQIVPTRLTKDPRGASSPSVSRLCTNAPPMTTARSAPCAPRKTVVTDARFARLARDKTQRIFYTVELEDVPRRPRLSGVLSTPSGCSGSNRERKIPDSIRRSICEYRSCRPVGDEGVQPRV
jgi:hypothetical protein